MSYEAKRTSFSNLLGTIEYGDNAVLIRDMWDSFQVLGRYSGHLTYYNIFAIDEGHRIDLLANTYYDSPTLWWLPLLFNDIIDPFDPFPADTITGDIAKIRMIRSEFLSEIIYAIKVARRQQTSA